MPRALIVFQKSDYGSYKCVAKNPRGDTEGTIRLYGECLPFIAGALVSPPGGARPASFVIYVATMKNGRWSAVKSSFRIQRADAPEIGT